jgi:Ca2+-binding RTX toxin-like protein
MGTYTGLFIDETITPTFISPTVTADPAGSLPGAGADTIDGGEGADTMDGGDGDDTYYVDNTGDTVSETVGAPLGGVDLVFSSVNFTLSAGIENLTLIGLGNVNGTGNSGENVIEGESHDNILSGLGGSDSLFGYVGEDVLNGGTGADFMDGGDQNDTYIVDNIGDTANEQFGDAQAGVDEVFASVSHTLSANLEHLTLTGTSNINGTGNGKANLLTGNGRANTLSGLGDNDRLLGGDGIDILLGGDGTDTLRGQRNGDTLSGGLLADILVGGLGNDKFDFDDVTDSTPGARDSVQAGDGAIAFEGAGAGPGDRFDLADIDADAVLNGNQTFVMDGTMTRGKLWAVNIGMDTRIRGNIDNDAAVEFEFEILDGGVVAQDYTADDFFL